MIGPRLSVMMFLQFFVWGAWYVTPYLFLTTIGFTGGDVGWTYSVGPIAGMISPFFVGMIADRFFATERVLGILHIAGGWLMLLNASLMQSAVADGGDPPSAFVVNGIFFLHMLCYFPTLSLTNSLTLHNMTNAEKQFPIIRVFGTIGWIVAGVTVSLFEWDASYNMFYLAGGSGIVLGLYSFTLPHTPPPSKGSEISAREILGLDAFELLKRPSYLTFMICSFLICIPLAFYYQLASAFVDASGQAAPSFKMSFGQMSEIIFMVLMPLFFARLGVKWMLFVGMLMWVVRYGLFALASDDGTAWAVLTGVIVHGICYDFFFVTGQIYTDKVAPEEIRGQAQGMLVLFTLGIGMLIGAQVAGAIDENFTNELAKADSDKLQALNDDLAAKEKDILAVYGLENASAGAKMWNSISPKELPEDKAATLKQLQDSISEIRSERSEILLISKDWKTIWLIPCAFAGLVLLVFTGLFKDDSSESAAEEYSATEPIEQSPASEPAAENS